MTDTEGKVVPPSAGRQKSADIGEKAESTKDGAKVGPATAPAEDDERKAADPADTERGTTGSIADEKPTAQMPETDRDDDAVGPAHTAGTGRGEESPDVSERTLIAGIGNIFLGDDGFGCEVVRRLDDLEALPGVRVLDYGIRGMHLTYDLLDGWDLVVLVDALPDRGDPGAVEVLRVQAGGTDAGWPDAHGMDPMAVLATAAAMGAVLPQTCVVGAQVADVDERMGLSDPVAAAVEPAAAAVRSLVREVI